MIVAEFMYITTNKSDMDVSLEVYLKSFSMGDYQHKFCVCIILKIRK